MIKVIAVTMVLFLSLITLAGCARTPTQKGAGLGALIGAGTGAIIGHQRGKAAEGALIGAAAGAAGGALIGDATAIKFCPTCGADYAADVQYCPTDGTELKFKQQ